MPSLPEVLGLDNLQDWFNDVGHGISQIPSYFQGLGNDLANLPSSLWNQVQPALSGLGGQLGGLGDAVSGLWSGIQDLPQQFGGQLADLGSNLWGGLQDLGSNLGSQFNAGLGSLGQGLGNLGTNLWGGLQDLGSNLGGQLSQGFGNLGQGLGNLGSQFNAGLGSLGSQFSAGLGNLGSGLGDLGSSIWGGMQDLGSNLGNSISQGWDAVKQGAAQGWDAVKGLGSDIMSGIKDGLSGIWSGLKDAFGGIADPIKGWIDKLIGRGGSGGGDSVDTSQNSDAAWADARNEQERAARAAGPADTSTGAGGTGAGGNSSRGLGLDLGGALDLPNTADGASNPWSLAGRFALSNADWLPGGHSDALFGGQAKWDAEKALSDAMGYQASKEARVSRLQSEINAKFGVGNSPEAAQARAQLDALANAQGDAAENLAVRQVDDAYSQGLTGHRATMVGRGTANSGTDVTGRARLAGGLFQGRADAAMAGQKAAQDFRNTLDSARRQTLGTALFDPTQDVTGLLNKRNAVASAKSSAWTGMVGDAANNASAVGMGLGGLF